jgi:hypothetical protein
MFAVLGQTSAAKLVITTLHLKPLLGKIPNFFIPFSVEIEIFLIANRTILTFRRASIIR